MIQKPSNNLVSKYLNKKGSFYTSYPSVSLWKDDYYQNKSNDILNQLNFSNPTNIYIHFPFCVQQCYYCICHTVISNNREKMESFMDYLFKEIDIYSNYFKEKNITPNIEEIHLGGGSPTLMTHDNLIKLKEKLSSFISFNKIKEFNIEIDFRTIDKNDLEFYSNLGINRLSFGIQDFDLNVQESINRVQYADDLRKLLTTDIKNKFSSINFDLIYGFPNQTTETFKNTLNIVQEFNPDRISLYGYGHMPDFYKHHGFMNKEDMPGDNEKVNIKFDAIKNLTDNNYQMIGIDHFAKPKDSLAQAKVDNRLFRSFMGYTPGRCPNILGIGPSSMSSIESYYFQNVYSLKEYYSILENNILPIFRGYHLNNDDLIRREIINNLMTNFCVVFSNINKKFNINFKNYFENELNNFTELINDKIVIIDDSSIIITPVGENFARNVASIFDKYFEKGFAFGHSKEVMKK